MQDVVQNSLKYMHMSEAKSIWLAGELFLSIQISAGLFWSRALSRICNISFPFTTLEHSRASSISSVYFLLATSSFLSSSSMRRCAFWFFVSVSLIISVSAFTRSALLCFSVCNSRISWSLQTSWLFSSPIEKSEISFYFDMLTYQSLCLFLRLHLPIPKLFQSFA